MADNNDTPTGAFLRLTAPKIGEALGYTPAPEAKRTNGQHPAELEHQAEPDNTPRKRTTWWPVDLEDAINGGEEPKPTIWARTDGVCLIYPGKTHVFAGESESCKTWAVQSAAAQILSDFDGGRVLWIDYEDTAKTLVRRLKNLGVPDDTLRARLHFVRPEEPTYVRERYGPDTPTEAGLDLQDLAISGAYSLAVIDGVTEGMVTEGLDPLGTSDAAIWARRIAKRIADETGAAVITLDHVPKGNNDTAKRFSIGSQHKTSGLTGAFYSFEVKRVFQRALGNDTHTGLVTVSVGKDRPGHVRAHTTGNDMLAEIATLELSADPDGRVGVRLVPPGSSSTAPPLPLLVKIADQLAYTDGLSVSAVCNAIPGKHVVTREALKYMTEKGYVTVTKSGPGHYHYLTELARNELLDP